MHPTFAHIHDWSVGARANGWTIVGSLEVEIVDDDPRSVCIVRCRPMGSMA